MNKISLFSPSVGEEEIEAIRQVFFSGWLGMGTKTKEFEEEFAKFIGVNCCVAMNSCTSALEMSLKILNIGKGDEVMVPTITFVATAHAVVNNGASPIFCDIDDDLLIDFDDVMSKITKRTKAIVVVHVGGRCVDVELLKSIIPPNIKIIEDCAHACGSRFKNKSAGSFGDIGCFSFHATKNMTTGDGGMITLNNEELQNRAKKLSWLGINKSSYERAFGNSYLWNYDIEEIGNKSHMNDVNSAIGLVQLGKINQMNAVRKQIANVYFEKLNGVVLPRKDDENSLSSWHIFHIKTKDRDGLSKHLLQKGIGTGVHYKPIHMYKAYGNTPRLFKAEKDWIFLLSLPMHSGLSVEEAEFVAEGVNEYVA
jgi:perosamine synthetase